MLCLLKLNKVLVIVNKWIIWRIVFIFFFALKFEAMHIYNKEDPTDGFFEGCHIAIEIRSQYHMLLKKFWLTIYLDCLP